MEWTKLSINGNAYEYHEFDAQAGFFARAVRCFNVRPLDKPDQVYTVVIGGNIRKPFNLCDCMGFLSYGHCKHCDALRPLIDPLIKELR